MADDAYARLVSHMSAHNTAQLKEFFAGSEIEGDWQLIYAASYNGCIISLPARGGGTMRLRIAAKYRDDHAYLELRTERTGGDAAE